MNGFKWITLFILLLLWFPPAHAGTDPPKVGGTLPEISLKTRDAVMEKLDEWAAKGSEIA